MSKSFWGRLICVIVRWMRDRQRGEVPVFVAVPSAPSGLGGTIASATSIQLDWTDNSSNEAGFQVDQDGVIVTSVGVGVTTKVITGLTTGVEYDFRVRAINAGGVSSFSNTVSITPLAE